MFSQDPIITTTHGKVRGKKRITVYDDQYYCFDGIPYAKPPLAELRFKAPQPLSPGWLGVRDCTQVAQKSMQYNPITQQKEGAEDCLYLNVYAKELQSAEQLPVMVYIHGGAFNISEASRNCYGPDYFMMRDVVLFTVGYRLGALGFLRFRDKSLEIPGNAGLKDIVLALQWIKKNCNNFNGNSNNITIYGNSSGSASIHYLMLAPQCKGLFHKAILMSGLCLYQRHEKNMEYRLACQLGYKGKMNDKPIYEYLCSVDSTELVGVNLWTQNESESNPPPAFMPGIETYDSVDSIITREPIELMRTAWSNNVPIMLGHTSLEGLKNYKTFENSSFYEVLKKHVEYVLPMELRRNFDLNAQRNLAKKALAQHFGEKRLALENIEHMLELFSYTYVYHSLHRTLLSRRMHSRCSTYYLRFDFDSPTFNFYRIKYCGPDMRGVSHADELCYLFYQPNSFKLPSQSPEFKTILRMIDIWTTFAEKSNPNAGCISPVIWRPIERHGTPKCLNISNNLEFIDSPEHEKCEGWDKLYQEIGLDVY